MRRQHVSQSHVRCWYYIYGLALTSESKPGTYLKSWVIHGQVRKIGTCLGILNTKNLMLEINKEMMEVLRNQTGDVKATQKLEQQEAVASPEAEGTMSGGGITWVQKFEPSLRSSWGPGHKARCCSAGNGVSEEKEALQGPCAQQRGLLPFLSHTRGVGCWASIGVLGW